MKFIKLYESFQDHLLNDNILYHYTYTDNLGDILEDGIVPSKNINYENGVEGVFLTNKSSLYSINISSKMQEIIDDYLDYNEDELDISDRPVVRLHIDINSLNKDLFYPDDDYSLNVYKWNKARNKEDQLEESLKIWGSIAYKGIIKPNLIIKYDFDYFW